MSLSGKEFEGQVALVTGASRGIGRSIALALAEHGADIALHYGNSKPAAEEVAEKYPHWVDGSCSVRAT